MTIDTHPAALFVAAFLALGPKTTQPAWARIVAGVRPFAIHSSKEAAEGLAEAFRGSGSDALLSRPFNDRALAAAAGQAEAWLRQGVRVVTRKEIGRLKELGDDFPPVLFSRGDRSLLHRPAAAVLNSRKPRKIAPGEPWMLRTVSLVDRARAEQLILVASYGTLPYSLLTLSGKGSPLIVVCPEPLPFMQPHRALKSFFQDNAGVFLTKSTLFLSSFLPGPHLSRASRFAERDRLVGALASVIVVADVRPGGNMDEVLRRARKAGKRIAAEGGEHAGSAPCPTAVPSAPTFPRSLRHKIAPASGPTSRKEVCSWTGDTEPPSVAHDSKDLRVNLLSAEYSRPRLYPILRAVPEGMPLLVHYTRSCPGPWPGQTPAKYFRSLLDGAPCACHTAFDTLRRILRERLIRGGHRLTRGDTPVVSFTECMPAELADLVRWRRGLVRKWFEPYGIGIRKASLLALGVDRVVYGDERVYREMREEKKHLFQLCTSSGTDWAAEREWRLKGNLNLVDPAPEDVLVIVQTDEEAAIIQREYDAPVISAGLHGGLTVVEAGSPTREK